MKRSEDALWFDAYSYPPLVELTHSGTWYQLDWFGFTLNTIPIRGGFFMQVRMDLSQSYRKGSYDNWIYFPKAGWLWTSN